MIVSKQNRLEFIDFAKGFAIFFIVVFHYFYPYLSGLLSQAIMVGGTGVHLFFLISGFGLTLSRKEFHAVDFYKHRFVSVLLPYYFIVLVSYLVGLFIPYFNGNGLYALAGHILLYKMFDENIIGSFGYPLWFMSTIIQFYIAYPFLRRWMNSVSGRSFLGGSLLLSVVYWCLIALGGVEQMRVFNSFFIQYIWEFCLGMYLAKMYTQSGVQFWDRSPPLLLVSAVAGLGVMGVLAIKGGDVGKIFNDIPASLGYLALCAFVFKLTDKIFPAVKHAFVHIGMFSYHLYLVHMLVYVVVMRELSKIDPSGLPLVHGLVVVLPLTMVIAYFFSKLRFDALAHKMFLSMGR